MKPQPNNSWLVKAITLLLAVALWYAIRQHVTPLTSDTTPKAAVQTER